MTVPLLEAPGAPGTVILHRFRMLDRVHPSEREGGYLDDLKAAINHATMVEDFHGARRLLYLHCDYLENLTAANTDLLIAYLESKGIWREYAPWPVFKTAGQPCIAFTAGVGVENNSVDLMLLGACYRYPGGTDEQWWQATIRPRVESLAP